MVLFSVFMTSSKVEVLNSLVFDALLDVTRNLSAHSVRIPYVRVLADPPSSTSLENTFAFSLHILF
jgi:hypothetical protein